MTAKQVLKKLEKLKNQGKEISLEDIGCTIDEWNKAMDLEDKKGDQKKC